jgi:hypothetical protein
MRPSPGVMPAHRDLRSTAQYRDRVCRVAPVGRPCPIAPRLRACSRWESSARSISRLARNSNTRGAPAIRNGGRSNAAGAGGKRSQTVMICGRLYCVSEEFGGSSLDDDRRQDELPGLVGQMTLGKTDVAAQRRRETTAMSTAIMKGDVEAVLAALWPVSVPANASTGVEEAIGGPRVGSPGRPLSASEAP